MVNETVRVVARVTAKSEHVAEIKSILKRLVEQTRMETGCIDYRLLQDAHDPAEFATIEEWTSNAAIDAHFSTPHLQEALSQATPLLATVPDIRRYVVVA